jgi:hypothetical protein
MSPQGCVALILGMGDLSLSFVTMQSEAIGSQKKFSRNVAKLDFYTQSCIVYTIRKKAHLHCKQLAEQSLRVGFQRLGDFSLSKGGVFGNITGQFVSQQVEFVMCV